MILFEHKITTHFKNNKNILSSKHFMFVSYYYYFILLFVINYFRTFDLSVNDTLVVTGHALLCGYSASYKMISIYTAVKLGAALAAVMA